jgi:hypothetical protein
MRPDPHAFQHGIPDGLDSIDRRTLLVEPLQEAVGVEMLVPPPEPLHRDGSGRCRDGSTWSLGHGREG